MTKKLGINQVIKLINNILEKNGCLIGVGQDMDDPEGIVLVVGKSEEAIAKKFHKNFYEYLGSGDSVS